MNWVAEGVLNRNQPWQNWKPKYFVLKGSDVCIFDAPPVSKLFTLMSCNLYSFHQVFTAQQTREKFLENSNSPEKSHYTLYHQSTLITDDCLGL